MSESVTSPGKPGVLPDEAVRRLFQRFTLRYGSKWLDMWVGVPLDDVYAEWAAELSRFELRQIGGAIRHAGKFPPTLPEFIELCEAQPRTYTGPPMLTVVKGEAVPMPEHIRRQLAQFLRGHAVNGKEGT